MGSDETGEACPVGQFGEGKSRLISEVNGEENVQKKIDVDFRRWEGEPKESPAIQIGGGIGT